MQRTVKFLFCFLGLALSFGVTFADAPALSPEVTVCQPEFSADPCSISKQLGNSGTLDPAGLRCGGAPTDCGSDGHGPKPV